MSKFTAELTFEPFALAELDEVARPVAVAIRDSIVAGIKAIPPRPDGSRPFNDTGKLVAGIRLEKHSDGSYSVMAPPDRLQDPRILTKLHEMVPVLDDPLAIPAVDAAIVKSLDDIVK